METTITNNAKLISGGLVITLLVLLYGATTTHPGVSTYPKTATKIENMQLL